MAQMGHEITIFRQSNSNMYQISSLNEYRALTPDTIQTNGP